MWSELGFEESPYDVKPLAISKEDARLLVGRKKEAIAFATSLESAKGGAFVIAGRPGVGKTSFLNAQQYFLWSGSAPFGPKILPSFKAYSVQPNDTAKEICIGCLDALISSIEFGFATRGKKVSKEFANIRAWRQGSQKISGGTIMVLGIGGGMTRSFDAPSVSAAPLDLLCDMINTLVIEAKNKLGVEKIAVSIDNIDNLPDAKVPEVFVALRDNLFVIEYLWVFAIGQENLMSIVRAEAPKAAERVLAFIEVSPLDLDEIIEAIASRVARFSQKGVGSAPITERIHKLIYTASSGEIRFTFQTCNMICKKFIEELREQVLQSSVPIHQKIGIESLLAEHLVNNVIPDNTCEYYLEQMVLEEVKNLKLTSSESRTLSKICEKGSVANKDWKACGANGARPFNKACSKYVELGLLRRFRTRRVYQYEPAGLLTLAHELHLSLIDGD